MRYLLQLHIASGTLALMVLAIPLVARKGSRVHVRAGSVYAAGMTVVAATGVVMSVWRLGTDPEPSHRDFALFLLYVSLLTAAALSIAVRVLRQKGRTAAHRHWWDLGLPAALFGFALFVLAWGLLRGAWLFAAFSIIGLATGAEHLRYWLRAPRDPMHWWYVHMDGMLGSAIAALTAVSVVNAPRLGLPVDSPVVWFAPAAVLVPVTSAWIRYYRRRFATAPGARRDTSRRAPAGAPCRPSHSA